MSNLHSFNIEDHQYTVRPFSTMEGTPLALEFWALASEPIAAILPQLENMKGIDPDDDISTLFQKLDADVVASSLKGVFQALAKRPELVREVFRGTSRDGKDLDADHNYEAAYTANWKEWLLALRKIVQVNGWLLFFGTMAE